MRRTFLALVGLSVMVTVLIGLKSGPAASLLGWSAESGLGPDGTSGLPPTGAAVPDGATPDPSGAAAPAVSGSPPAGPTASGPAATSGPAPTGGPAPSSAAPPPPPPPQTTTVTGAAVEVRTAQSPTSKSEPCGDCHDYTISVTVTVTDGRVTATSVAYNPSPGGSLSYANQANNRLSQAILSAQTWNLGRVSGATYSGNAWELSAQDAMRRAGLPV